ncbi:E3 SUMO-protein ligase SIZ1 [Linum perenne]
MLFFSVIFQRVFKFLSSSSSIFFSFSGLVGLVARQITATSSSLQDKLVYFRIKELKDVLTQLGLSKQGKKQDLVDRILSVLSDDQASKGWPKRGAVGKDEAAKLVDDIYRKMQVSGADLASKPQSVLDSSNTKIKGEPEDSFHCDAKVRCPCGSTLETESMIKCEEPRCQVWQHLGCVVVAEKPMEGSPQVPEVFYCETCRLSRADPFWITIAQPLYPVKMVTTSMPTDGSNPVQSVDKSFHLTRADKDLLTKPEIDVQAWCMLFNDKVPFRMQWPQYADLQVNGVPVRAINRPGSQLLGVNGRDDGPIITPCTKDGINKISLTGCDARFFCFGVRIVKRRTLQQILGIIPKEPDGERFEDALARVCRCVGGGAATDGADSDSDLEVVADSISVNLRCPMSGSRMKVAGRFKPCIHMGCFDLNVFVELNQRSRKWQCPICLKNYSLENVIIDPYFNRITTKMRHCGEDIAEIEVKPDGSWRVKTRTEAERREVGELAQWHNPNGTPCMPNVDVRPKVETGKEIKLEGGSEGHGFPCLKLGIRKNSNGFWEVSKPEDTNASSSGNKLQDKFETLEQKVIPMNSSATASEDPSVNQGGGGNLDLTNSGIELDSLALNIDPTYGFGEQNISAPAGDAEIIVLSDTDDEADHDILVSSGTGFNNNQNVAGAGFSVAQSGLPEPYLGDANLGAPENSCLGLFTGNGDEFELPPWPPQGGPGFQLFSSDVSDPLVDLQHGPINCSTSMDGYNLAPEASVGHCNIVLDSSVGRSDTNDGLVDNPLAFEEDPSLQLFLPTRPSESSMHSNLRDQVDVSNGVRSEDWISLRLGGAGSAGGHGHATPANGLDPRQWMPNRDITKDSLTDTASLLLGMNNGTSEKANHKRTESPFSFPRQKRSVRPRLYLSIDTDSE